MFYAKYFLKVCVKCDNILKTETCNATKQFVFFFLIKYEIPESDKQCHFKHVVDDEHTQKIIHFLYIESPISFATSLLKYSEKIIHGFENYRRNEMIKKIMYI